MIEDKAYFISRERNGLFSEDKVVMLASLSRKEFIAMSEGFSFGIE